MRSHGWEDASDLSQSCSSVQSNIKIISLADVAMTSDFQLCNHGHLVCLEPAWRGTSPNAQPITPIICQHSALLQCMEGGSQLEARCTSDRRLLGNSTRQGCSFILLRLNASGLRQILNIAVHYCCASPLNTLQAWDLPTRADLSSEGHASWRTPPLNLQR